MDKILVWGTGNCANFLMKSTKKLVDMFNIEIIGFIDNNNDKIGKTFYDKPIYSPQNIKNLPFDSILIYAWDGNFNYTKIYKQLVEDMNIPSHKIGSFAELVFEAQKRQRESLNVRQTRTPVIYDCFPFFNEREILHIRMETLSPFVDYFVIVEMNQDHRGKSKPYNFLKIANEFSEYRDKIIYVQPENIPAFSGIGDWTLENFQRNCITLGLGSAEPEDIICISDCDEIINPKILTALRKQQYNYHMEPMTKILETGALALEQTYFCYFFNCRLRYKQNTSLIVKYKNLIEPNIIREAKNFLPHIKDGGWHLTYFGGLERVKIKIKSIVEGTPVSDEDMSYRIKKGLDPYGREGEIFDTDFLKKEEIDIPNIEKYIEQYPQFYHEID